MTVSLVLACALIGDIHDQFLPNNITRPPSMPFFFPIIIIVAF